MDPNELTPDEWDHIGRAPLIAFLLVAAADGNIDKKEANVCVDDLTELSTQQTHPLTARMMERALAIMPTALPELMNSENPMEDLLGVNGLINDKIGGQDAKIMKTSVLLMGEKIAKASGGFFGFGKKIDKDEEQALQLLKSVFDDDQSSASSLAALPDAPEPTEEESRQWYEDKSKLMEGIFGKEHDMVMHAIIPFEAGGTLHLYYFPNDIPGTAIATKQLSASPHQGSSNEFFKVYELAMFTRHPLDMDRANDDSTEFGQAHKNIQSVLNPIARYSVEATLTPNETCEFPAEMEGIGGKCLIFDAYKADTPSDFGVLTVIEIHRSEMDFARNNGGGALLEKLKQAGHYPYSDMARIPVA